MRKILLKDLRAIRPYETIERGMVLNGRTESWVFIKLPNHFWTGYRGEPLLSDRELFEQGKPIAKDEVKDLIDCDEKTFERYEILKREEI